MPRYTLEAGRCVMCNGRALFTLHGVGQYDPAETDLYARMIVELFNLAVEAGNLRIGPRMAAAAAADAGERLSPKP